MGGLHALSSGALQGRAPGEAAVGRSRQCQRGRLARLGLYTAVTSLRYGQVGEGFRKARRQSSNPAPACCAIIPRGTPPWRACHAPGTFSATNSPLSTHQSLLPGCLRLGSLPDMAKLLTALCAALMLCGAAQASLWGRKRGIRSGNTRARGYPASRSGPTGTGDGGGARPRVLLLPSQPSPKGHQRAA